MSRVYVGRLPSRCSERDVERFFRDYGKIREIVLKNGYGFVEFDHHKDAEDAVYDLNGRELRGERVIIEHAKLPPGRDSRGHGGGGGSSSYGYRGGSSRRESSRYGPPTRTEYRAIVENLSSRISWQDLKDTMRKAGEVCYADAHRSNRNEGIVEFRSREDLKAAIERFDGYELNGRKLKVFEERSKRKSSSRSRSRSSHSRSKSRSRSPRRRRSGGSEKRSRSKSASRSVSRSKSRSRSPVVKRSRSGSVVVNKRSRSPLARETSRSKSRSRSHSNGGGRSQSASPRRKTARSTSHSRSASPASDRD